MVEEKQNAAPTKALSMTQAAIRKRESRARIAARQDAALPEEAREERAKARVQAQWKANWDALSQAKKDEFNECVRHHNATHTLIDEFTLAISDATTLQKWVGAELTGDGIQFYKNIFVDVEALAEQYPPTEDSFYLGAQYYGHDDIEFAKLESELEQYPAFCRLYGEAVDHIHAPTYSSFLYYFSRFYLKYRNAGVVEPDDEFAISWEKVDELVRKNKRLSDEYSPIRCYWPKESIGVVSTTAQPRPLSEVELIQKAVSERHAASLGIQE